MSILVKDGNGVDRYYHTTGAGSPSYPFMPVVPDFRLQHAVRVISDTYGDTVDIWEKAKTLRKFGSNSTVGTSWETIAQYQGTVANETYVTTNIIDSIVSSSASDNTQTITIEGHTIDGSGNLTFVEQDAVLNGQTEVTLTTPLARATRAYIKNSGTFGSTPNSPVGNIYIYDNADGITSGVPNTPAATKLMILATETQTQKAATSISSSDYYIVTGFSAGIGVSGSSASVVLVRLETRDLANGGTWRPIGRTISLPPDSVGVSISNDPCIIVPNNHDVRMRAKTDANTADVFAEFDGYLAEIV